MKNLIFFFLISLIFMSCSTKNENPEKWSEVELNTWFKKQDWLNGWQARPDNSINKREFAIQYYKNSKHWDQAFNFLKSSDLLSLPVGRQELEGEHLFVIVSEYVSKNKSETKYESHKNYIDIQYVISGNELMGVTSAEMVQVSEPYNEENDITFHDYDGGDYILANPDNFLIFFPSDIHRPSVKTEKNINVKKIVVKILVE